MISTKKVPLFALASLVLVGCAGGGGNRRPAPFAYAIRNDAIERYSPNGSSLVVESGLVLFMQDLAVTNSGAGIIFIGDNPFGGIRGIFAAGANGGTPQKLYEFVPHSNNSHIAVSDLTRRIFFTDETPQGAYGVYSVDADGHNIQDWADIGGIDPASPIAWSDRDGLFYSVIENGEEFIFNQDPNRSFNPQPIDTEQCTMPSTTPDGRIMYVRISATNPVVIFDPLTQQRTVIEIPAVGGGSPGASYPVMLSDLDSIVFMRTDDVGGLIMSQLYVYSISAQTVTLLPDSTQVSALASAGAR